MGVMMSTTSAVGVHIRHHADTAVLQRLQIAHLQHLGIGGLIDLIGIDLRPVVCSDNFKYFSFFPL